MPYLISGLAGAAGVVVLLAVLVWLAGAARRLAGMVRCGRAHWAEGTGLLAARIAALRVQLAGEDATMRAVPAQRRSRNIDPAPKAREGSNW